MSADLPPDPFDASADTDPVKEPSNNPASGPAVEPPSDPVSDPGRPDPHPSFPASWPLPGDSAALNPLAPPAELTAWPAPAPAPAPAPGAPTAPPPPPPYRFGASDDLSAAAPSTPSVPWDRHQDPSPPARSTTTAGGRLVEAAGGNALYWVGGAVAVFVALSALFFSVLARSSDPDAAAADTSAAAASVDGAGRAAGAVDGDAAAALPVSATGALSSDSEGVEGTTGATGTDLSGGTGSTTGMTTDATRTSTGSTAASDGAPSSLPSAADGAEVGGAFVVPAGYRRYDDPQHGFSVRVPAAWREARRSAGPGDAAEATDYDVIFESPEGEQRLAVSVWSAAERPPFESWLKTAVAGMRPLDDGAVHGDGVPYNAFLAGEPALVLGAAETPISHLSYAAFLQHADRYMRIAWADLTGLTRPDEVLGALASFGWVGDDIVTGSVPHANQVPWLRLPQGVYWPSEVLFGDGG